MRLPSLLPSLLPLDLSSTLSSDSRHSFYRIADAPSISHFSFLYGPTLVTPSTYTPFSFHFYSYFTSLSFMDQPSSLLHRIPLSPFTFTLTLLIYCPTRSIPSLQPSSLIPIYPFLLISFFLLWLLFIYSPTLAAHSHIPISPFSSLASLYL
ncbi:hypothetical protein DFH29DRAFT_506454 [Suillus ampliporus]|nr:hypothetical protein DFH29DRAFT_506454 [Suillus ampliporus]